jgi:hypothetical protein
MKTLSTLDGHADTRHDTWNAPEIGISPARQAFSKYLVVDINSHQLKIWMQYASGHDTNLNVWLDETAQSSDISMGQDEFRRGSGNRSAGVP